MTEDEVFEVASTVWRWRPAKPSGGGWFFLTVEGQVAAEIRFAAMGRTGGFGSIKVNATIGDTRWETSLFPHKESGGFLLPLKAEVRRRENIEAGGEVVVRLEV